VKVFPPWDPKNPKLWPPRSGKFRSRLDKFALCVRPPCGSARSLGRAPVEGSIWAPASRRLRCALKNKG
jgi:hypothetical protein